MTFQCGMCGETFVSGWTAAERDAEADAVFPGLPAEQRVSVCDEWYKLIMDNEHVQREVEMWQKRSRERPS